MRVNADFSRKVVVRPRDYDWTGSPADGVERMMLDRVGDEVARATSLVRFAAGSSFAAHEHGGGEEFLVLNGTFQDETGDFPAGTYVRNPPGTSHAPRSEMGCTILVKLRQFAPDDRAQFSIDTKAVEFRPGAHDGLTEHLLHELPGETVRMVRFAPDTELPEHEHPGGEEFFVLEGTVSDADGDYPAGSWVRSPAGSAHAPFSRGGGLIWIKTGHLDGL